MRVLHLSDRQGRGYGLVADASAPYESVTSYTPATVARYRVGGKLGRTVYAQLGARPAADDPLLGIMETPALAQIVVDLLNEDAPALAGVVQIVTGDGRVVTEARLEAGE